MPQPTRFRQPTWRRFLPGGARRDTASRQAAEQEGRTSEGRAALWLRLKGYRILATRLRTPVGEIDLIARRGPLTCFVEVKHRASAAAAAQAITPTQRKRIERAAEWWLAQASDRTTPQLRFDMITMVPGRLPIHLPDAWRRDQP